MNYLGYLGISEETEGRIADMVVKILANSRSDKQMWQKVKKTLEEMTPKEAFLLGAHLESAVGALLKELEKLKEKS